MRAMVLRRPRHYGIIRINGKAVGHHHEVFMLRPLAGRRTIVEDGRQVVRPRVGRASDPFGLGDSVPQGLLAAGVHIAAAMVGQGQCQRRPGPIDANCIGSGQLSLCRGFAASMIMVAMGSSGRRAINVAEDFAACHTTTPFSFKVNLQSQSRKELQKGFMYCMTRLTRSLTRNFLLKSQDSN